MITVLHASLPVDDFETAYAWYQIFFSRRADSSPQDGEGRQANRNAGSQRPSPP